jgi:hypothetical protein
MHRTIVLLAAWTLSACASQYGSEPTIVTELPPPDETLVQTHVLWVPANKELRRLVIPPGRKHVVATTSKSLRHLGACELVCFSPDGSVVGGPREVDPEQVTSGAAEGELLYLAWHRAHLVRTPDFVETERSANLGLDVDWAVTLGVTEIDRVGRPAWVAYGERVVRIESRPTWTTAKYASPVGFVQGVRGIPGSSHVVVVGGPNRLAVMDIDTGETLRREVLPCAKVGFDVVCDGRRAWIATMDKSGAFLEVALSGDRGIVVRPTGVPANNRLALSRDGRTLAVVAYSDGSPVCRATVLLFDVTGDTPRAVGRTSFECDDGVGDVAVFDDGRTVVLAGQPGIARIIEFGAAPK